MRPWTGSWRWIMLVLLAWGTLLFYIGGHLVRDSEHPERSSRELSKILAKLERLKQQNEDLRRMAETLSVSVGCYNISQGFSVSRKHEALWDFHHTSLTAVPKPWLPDGQADGGPGTVGKLRSLEEQLIRAKEKINSYRSLPADGPGKDQEELRRKVENGVRELWYFVRSELKKVGQVEAGALQKHVDTLLQDLGHQQRSIMTDLYHLSQADGAGDWREKEAKELSDLVQNRITYLQNPQDCSKARKLVCNINKGCGYGCQLHHVVYCFMIAYGTQRTLILESQNWRYATGGWETVFKPVSETCSDRTGASTGHWSGEANDRDVQVIELPIVDSLHPRPPYLPLAIPEDLADRLQRLHGDPPVWWVSQFVKYLIRPQAWLLKEIQEATAKMGFKHPIIGYPDYEFISDNSISWSAGLHNRYTENSLRGVILDIHFLSSTNFLVCTFSSQVCRVAYEIMQTLHPDASSFFYSLDDIYYFGGQNAHNQIAIYPHQPRNSDDIPLEPGDVIGVAGNHWDGYSKGINRKTGRTGLYPSYKVKEKIETVKYPTYPEADKLLKKP
ncbi:Alpha-(1,6)-fucosyltransferase [Labeo rohita]|uniref:Alpha-(1,6)-fucosyltransferase n=1 Tax=Labeo rohita TaxID=84645 RepID=A0ABQ8LV16_LABRO|nr:Alpha-(1,6)-fucosyltransferase [Labeo rohita]